MNRIAFYVVLVGLTVTALIGLGGHAAYAMAAKTDLFDVAPVMPAVQVVSAAASSGVEHHQVSQDERAFPGHHEGRHGGASGAAGVSSCCASACSPMMFADSQFMMSSTIFSDRYFFSNTAVTDSIYGDPPLRPPRSAAA